MRCIIQIHKIPRHIDVLFIIRPQSNGQTMVHQDLQLMVDIYHSQSYWKSIIKIYKMSRVLMFCLFLDHNLVVKPWIWNFIVKLTLTIVKITLNQYYYYFKLGIGLELDLGFKLDLLSHINITLYVFCLPFFTARTMCLI
jgi:hypothetical protein